MAGEIRLQRVELSDRKSASMRPQHNGRGNTHTKYFKIQGYKLQ